jgi:hypothetical protein
MLCMLCMPRTAPSSQSVYGLNFDSMLPCKLKRLSIPVGSLLVNCESVSKGDPYAIGALEVSPSLGLHEMSFSIKVYVST